MQRDVIGRPGTHSRAFHPSTSVVEDPLQLDRDYGKDEIVRVHFLFLFFHLPSYIVRQQFKSGSFVSKIWIFVDRSLERAVLRLRLT